MDGVKSINLQVQTELTETPENCELNTESYYLSKIIETEGFTNYEIKVNKIPTYSNLVENLYEVFIKGTAETEEKEIDLIMKKVIKLGSKDEINVSKHVFSTEMFIHTEFKNIISDLQNNASIPNNEKYKIVNFHDAPDDTTLILDNMTTKGYKFFDRRQQIPLRFAEKAVIQLAKFHSFSFVLKQTEPKLYNEVIRTKGNVMNMSENFINLADMCFKSCIDVLQSEEAKQKVTEFRDKLKDKYYNYYYNDKTDDANFVLCHGDYKVDNMLLLIQNRKITDLVPINYQLAHFGHPLNDFFYFIFTSTDQKLRRHYMPYFKNLYYRSLKSFLLYFDIDIETVYSKDIFEKDYKARMEVGLMAAIQVLPLLLASEEEYTDSKKGVEGSKEFKQDVYVQRVNEVVEDLIEWRHL